MDRDAFAAQAKSMIMLAKARMTPGRVKIMALLLAQTSAVSHLEIEAAQADQDKIDRVTVYRILEWLIANTLAHKILGTDRIWRFRANDKQNRHPHHAHFKCENCHEIYCLDEVGTTRKALHLPAGYSISAIDVTIIGRCEQCR